MIDTSLLKSGDNVLFHTKGFSLISMAIRSLTCSYFNHVGKFYWEADGTGYVIEALFKGVVKTPFIKYLNPSGQKNYELKVVRLKKEAFKDEKEYKEGLETARKRMYFSLGVKYDFGAIVFLTLKYTLKSWFRKIPKVNLFQSREKVYCSEIVCQADHGISSKFPYFYQGKTKASCATTSPKDTGWHNVEFITGKNVL